MNADEGFRRAYRIYSYRLWVVVIVPVGAFTYNYLSGPEPLDVEPDLWFWLRPTFLAAVVIFLLAVATWVARGFLAPSDKRGQPGR